MPITREDIITTIRQAKVVDAPEQLRPEMKLTDQGIDSLNMFSIILAVQEKYDLDIPDEDIDHLHSIDDLVGYVSDHTNHI